MNNMVEANTPSPIPAWTKVRTGALLALGVATIAFASFVAVSNLSKSGLDALAVTSQVEVSAQLARLETGGVVYYLVSSSEQALQAEMRINATLMEEYLLSVSGARASVRPIRSVIVWADSSQEGLQAQQELIVTEREAMLAGQVDISVIDLRDN